MGFQITLKIAFRALLKNKMRAGLTVLGVVIGIAAVIIARATGVFGVFPLLSAIRVTDALPYASRSILFWGGLRGAVTLALALSLPTSLDYWWTIQSIAFGVVLFTLLVQATTMASVIQRSGDNKA